MFTFQQPIMYSIYVTNKHDRLVFARLSSEKMQYADSFVQQIKKEIFDRTGRVWTSEYTSFLALGGFYPMPPGKTRAFSLENAAASMYVSVMHSSRVGVVNFPFNPRMYGCLTISEDSHGIVISPYNPKAVWLQAKTDDSLPSNVIESGDGYNDNERLYFGRKPRLDGGLPCTVTSIDGCCKKWMVAVDYSARVYESGELLKNTGFELIRANRGDPIPPNAVMTGVKADDGSLFVGRVGCSIPCQVTITDGKIDSFVYILGEKENTEPKRVGNGEVMVLTT